MSTQNHGVVLMKPRPDHERRAEDRGEATEDETLAEPVRQPRGRRPGDAGPRRAIETARAWVRGDLSMMATRAAGGHATGAARDLQGAARFAAYAAGQAAVGAHIAEHDLGAAAYAIKAVVAAAPRRPGGGRPGRRVRVAA